ncbi:MAG: NHLP bacteriocin system secretion protein [Calothrix sp. MO_167.B12]|nr:NHLP bacteriocin system secretion protein [Calothrix sp. MO_167.B12]
MKTKRKNNIFRQESVERLSSPEQLDQLMQVVSRRNWLPLATLGGLVAIALIWSIFGKIPINVNSKGVLIRPRRVVKIESPVQGQLKDLPVKVGDCVNKGDVLATIDPSDIRQKLQQEKDKLVQLQSQGQEASTLEKQRTNLETLAIKQQQISKRQRLQNALALSPVLKDRGIEAIKQERASLQKKLRAAQAMTPILKDKGIKAIKEQKKSLQKNLQDAHALVPSLKERFEKRRLLSKQGAISSDQVLQAEQEYQQNIQNILKLEADLKQLDVQETEVEQKYLDNLSTISQYQAQVRELDVKETEIQQKYRENLSTISQLKAESQELNTQQKRLQQQNLEASSQRRNKIQEVKHNIAQFSKQYQDNRTIESPLAGCILELTASNGSVLSPATRIGSIQLNNSQPIVGIIYFPVGDGKKIKQGMEIYVTPDTVRRERFGGIVGTVTQVSAFPMTKEGATTLVGNAELVEDLISEVGPVIEVRAQLQPDSSTPSGYRWSSSQGPANLQVSSGTTATARVTVEKQAPITLILPLLREWSGIY